MIRSRRIPQGVLHQVGRCDRSGAFNVRWTRFPIATTVICCQLQFGRVFDR